MNIKKYYLTKSLNTRRFEKINEVKYIIITSSKYKGFSALKNRNIIEKLKYKEDKEFSCHYIIDTDGTVLNIIPEKEKALCSRIANFDDKSISIMLTLNKNGNYDELEIFSLAKLINSIKKRYNIKSKNVLTEFEINSSRKPILFCDEPILLWQINNAIK